ncbi:hypothetical protein MnTg02_03416 [bacterium MnTg02]|nr:hypothetical protein MnTg02_03416 [bacterium MnTg02]
MRQGQQNRRGRGRGGRRTQNPLTRNYESNGPDVKIRGTAAHVAEKYGSLARDAVSSSDPVTAENYFQHAEHYNRIIMAAQLQMQPNVLQPAETTLNGASAAAPAAAPTPAPAQAKPKAEPADDAELGTVATANSSPLGVAEKPELAVVPQKTDSQPQKTDSQPQKTDSQADGNKRRRRRTSGNGAADAVDARASTATKNKEKSAQPTENGVETPAAEDDVPPDGAVV